jgi:type IV pilus assembly protein PilX
MDQTHTNSKRRANEKGMSLIMVLLVLVVVSMLGVSSAQIGLLGERSARNDRDQQIAWQAAEAALLDAEIEMSSGKRKAYFDGKNLVPFLSGCGSTVDSRGLCVLNINPDDQPAWLTVDYLAEGNSAPTTKLGMFTGRSYAAGSLGIQPAKWPRYVIEPIPDPSSDVTDPTYLYRVTAMGFGPSEETQAVLQMTYRP